MSKDRKKLLHIHSSVNDKQPTPATLEIGELGVNNAEGNAFISTKNSNGEVVRFSEDETIIGWMEEKEVFPYEAYVRGSDNSQVGGVTEQDLVNNRSNIIIKLNQVVPANTDYSPYDEKVNGAKDIYGNLINPISSGSYKDGAGLAIDMSRYAMIGANPSFSSITTTCGTLLQGTTKIQGTYGSCGSLLDIDVNETSIVSDYIHEKSKHIALVASGGSDASDGVISCYGTERVILTAAENPAPSTTKSVIVLNNEGEVRIYGTDIIETANTTDINSCDRISAATDNYTLKECTLGNGNVGIDTTNVHVSASTTDIKSCNEIKFESKNIVLTDGNCGNGEITIEANDLCLAGEDKVNLYGKETNVGIDCDDETPQVAVNTNIVGNNVSITANDNGGITIGGNGTYPITYTRRVKDENCPITSTTVDDALKEVFNRSKISITQDGNTFTLYQDSGDCKTSVDFTIKETIVSMSAETYPASDELLKKYTLWQTINGVDSEIGTIDIPKDHLLKDVSVVWGTVNENTFTPCTETSENCHWYIKMVYNVFDPSSGHTDDAVIYLPVDDFVKDIDEDNTDSNRGVNVNVWYDGKQNLVSADTTIHFDTPNDNTNEFTYGKRDGEHWISGTTVAFNSGSFSATTYKPWSASTTVNIPTEVSHLERGTLSLTHNGLTEQFDPATDKSIALPHETLTINYGATSGESGSVIFNTSEDKEIFIPTEISHLNRGEFTVEHNGDEVTYDPATSTSITLSHSALTIEYGATRGMSGSVVTFDTSADEKIFIPTDVGHLNRGILTYSHNGFSGTFDFAESGGTFTSPHSALTINYGAATSGESGSVTFDTSSAASISVPTSVSHLDRGTLSITHNGDEATYDPATSSSITLSHEALTIEYGVTCNNDDASGKTYDTSAEQTIIIPKTISDITNGKIVTNCENGCTTLNGGLCTDDVIKAAAFYSSSDLSLKENIKSIDINDFNKTNAISFKSFNFKDDENKTKTYGVIAQDVQSAGLNEIVHKDESGNLSVDYISLLILKIASLEDTIKNLTNEINNLKEAK